MRMEYFGLSRLFARSAVRSAFESRILGRIESQRSSPEYLNYMRVRQAVCRMMDDWEAVDPNTRASAYWSEELEGFLHLLDASPLMVSKLREQCYHITGLYPYEYRSHHAHKGKTFKAKYDMLKAVDASDLFVPEPAALGGFGFDLPAGRVNIDTLKFYEVLIGMDKAGELRRFREAGTDRPTAVEIGSGWGGFAYQFKTLCHNTTYVCVDLPPTMIFSGVYLLSLFPEAKALFYGEDGFQENIKNAKAYDFIFIPHFHFSKLGDLAIDLAINMVSFQEMTSKQVQRYASRLKEFGCPALYSMNKDRSSYNRQLSAVSEIVGKYFQIESVHVLDMQYNELTMPLQSRPLAITDYRHFVGR